MTETITQFVRILESHSKDSPAIREFKKQHPGRAMQKRFAELELKIQPPTLHSKLRHRDLVEEFGPYSPQVVAWRKANAGDTEFLDYAFSHERYAASQNNIEAPTSEVIPS